MNPLYQPTKEDLAGVWEEIRKRLETETGMDLGGDREERLLSAFRELVHDERVGSTEALLEHIRDPRRHAAFLERLVSQLTIGETFFFRNADHFRALRERILPAILQDRRRERTIRIWSAGCATGEEPYSLAILLQRDFPVLESWEIGILATDISTEFLAKAEAGRFRAWSFRGSELAGDERYFRAEGDECEISPKIRSKVRFRRLNLVHDIYPSPLTQTIGLDLILFRNVAIYLKESVTREILRRFARCLRPGGFLLLGEAEVQRDLFDPDAFEEIRENDTTLLRRTGAVGALRLHPILPFPREGPSRAETEFEAEDVVPPPEPQTPLDRARAAIAEGALHEARAILEEALGENPLQLEAHLLLACLSEESGDLDTATLSLRRAVYLEPEAPLPHFFLGIVHHRAGNHEEAARAFRNARDLAGKFPPEARIPHGEGLVAGRFLQILEDLATFEGDRA